MKTFLIVLVEVAGGKAPKSLSRIIFLSKAPINTWQVYAKYLIEINNL